MVLYRSAVLGLLVVVALLIVEGRDLSPIVVERAEPAPRRALDSAPTVVDVSKRAMAVGGTRIDAVLGLRPGEGIVLVVNGPYPCALSSASDLLHTQWVISEPGDFIDVIVGQVRGPKRRVLILVHP